MTALEIIQLGILGIVILAIAIYCIVMAVKNKWLQKLTEAIKIAIAEAEKKWPDGHGAEKKKYVVEEIKKKCDELKIPYALLRTLIDKFIDSVVEHYNAVTKK